MFNIIEYCKELKDCFNKKEICSLLAETGIILGSLIILVIIILSIIIMPFILICTPFSLLNQASKKWFKEKKQGQ